ncbi:MAG: hypothetical protein KBT68_06750 [bacterium]|nr:hypothetical protein [Candidatus Colisoma equi]
MKRMMMQLFRSLVTIIVVGTMAVMIFSLRSELAEAKTRARAIEWFRKNHITKLWLESYRHGERVETKLLEEERDAFRAAGFEACGMITPTKLNDPPEGGDAPFVVCWSDPTAQKRLTDTFMSDPVFPSTVIVA